MQDTSRRWLVFVLACQLFLLSQFYRTSVAVIAPDLIGELALDTGRLSLISAAFFYAFALMQIPIIMYLDGIGPRVSMTVLSLAAVAGAIVFAVGQSAAVLVAGRVLMGIGMACNLMGTLKLITLWFSPRYFATLSALVVSMGTIGNLFAATPLVMMAQAIGWRSSFGVIAAVNLLLTVLFYTVVRDRPTALPGHEVPPAASTRLSEIARTLGRLFKEKDYWIISLGTFSRYGVLAAVQALWAGPFLIGALGVPAVSAGNLLLLLSIGIAVGSPVSGWLSDTVFRNRKWVIVAGLLAMGSILIFFTRLTPETSISVLGVLFFSFGFFGSSGGIMYAHIKEQMPPENAGAAMTGINFFTMVGVAAFMQGMGSLMHYLHPEDSLGSAAFVGAFYLCAASLAITVFFYLFTKETLGKKVQP
jgi:sugar phosphate permease